MKERRSPGSAPPTLSSADVGLAREIADSRPDFIAGGQ